MTTARVHFLSLATVLAASVALLLPPANAQPSIIANAPVKNFRLPAFNPQGNRTSLLRGGEARYISNTQIDILELNFAQFRGDGSTDTTELLLAPSATVFIKEKNHILLTGKESVRLIGNGLEASGELWSYDDKDNHRLILTKNVRVVIDAPLHGILD